MSVGGCEGVSAGSVVWLSAMPKGVNTYLPER